MVIRQNNTNFSDVLSEETKRHYSNIDLARSIAILAVVLCHASTEVYKYGYEAMNVLPKIDQNAATLFLTFGRMGVPLFLYISGFLLLQKEYTNRLKRILLEKKTMDAYICHRNMDCSL